MLTYERYQALRAINIRVPGEPGNEARTGLWTGLLASFPGSHAPEREVVSLGTRLLDYGLRTQAPLCFSEGRSLDTQVVLQADDENFLGKVDLQN